MLMTPMTKVLVPMARVPPRQRRSTAAVGGTRPTGDSEGLIVVALTCLADAPNLPEMSQVVLVDVSCHLEDG